jgi:hypothetical protein
MLCRRKPVAALAAVTAACAIAVLAPSASAASSPAPTVDPTVCQLFNISTGPFGPGMFLGGASLDATLANAGSMVGCQAQPQQSLLPIGQAQPTSPQQSLLPLG